MTQRVAMLMTRMRMDEKRIVAALEARDAVVEAIPDHTLVFDPHTDARGQYDVIVDRSLHLSRSRYVTTLFQAAGIPTVNTPAVINLCSNKLRQSTVLHEAGVPVPAVRIAFSPKAAVEAMEEIGYPVVLKPIIGTGGQLVSLIEDRDAAEAVLEHKATLGSAHHEVFYIEEYVPKPGRDLRATVVGGQVLAVEARSGGGWRIGANRHLKVGCDRRFDGDLRCRDARLAGDCRLRRRRARGGYFGAPGARPARRRGELRRRVPRDRGGDGRGHRRGHRGLCALRRAAWRAPRRGGRP